jgi:polyferredoxin
VEKVVPYGEKIVYPEPLVTRLDRDSGYVVPLAVTFAILVAIVAVAAFVIYLVWRRRWCRKKQ